MRLEALCLAALLCTTSALALVSTSSGTQNPASLNVRDFGAKGDGSFDDTQAFQHAIDASTSGAEVIVPAGRYMIRSHLEVREGVTLKGTYQAPPTMMEGQGSVLLAVEGKGNAEATPFITLLRGAGLHGMQVFYPEQTTGVLAYPWCVRAIGDNCSIKNCLLINPYQAADFGTFPAGRHLISGLYGQPLKTGLFVDKCFDVGRVENVHFWPFWTEQVMKWTAANGTAFVFGRTDWEYVTGCFAISYAVGFHFTEKADGPGNVLVNESGSDIGPLAVKAETVQPHSGVSFVNCQFMSGVETGNMNLGPVKFTACGFWPVSKESDTLVRVRGEGRVSLTACHFAAWGERNTTAPCIVAETGGLTLNGCEFLAADPAKVHVELGEDVQNALIYGNAFRSEPKIINRSEGQVEIALNASGKPSRMVSALDKGNADELASLWQARLGRSPESSHTMELRLSSAQVLAHSRHGELRTRLLQSIANTPDPLPQEQAYVQRAKDELALDRDPQSNHRPAVHAARLSGSAPRIDGKLDDPQWQTAPVAAFPAEDTSTQTQVRLLWDDEALYVSAQLNEPAPEKMVTVATEHDGQLWTDDCLELFLAPKGIIHRYEQMIVNSRGAWYDGTGTLRSTESGLWNTTPLLRTARNAQGWTIEMRLTWKDIAHGTPKKGDLWTADLRRWRFASGQPQYESWAKAPLKGSTHHPEAFGYLRFD